MLTGFVLFLALAGLAFLAGIWRARGAGAMPYYYGTCAALWAVTAAAGALMAGWIWGSLGTRNTSWALLTGSMAGAIAILAGTLVMARPSFRARQHAEGWIRMFLLACTALSVALTLFIAVSLAWESWRFFHAVPVTEFLFGLQWSPQLALRDDQAGSSGAFGAAPVFLGTLLVTVIAMLVAAPFGLMSAVYLAEYAAPRTRAAVKPALEILAGIPTVVYGYFAAVTFGPALSRAGQALGLDVASESALAAGVVMGVMIIPFVLSLADDVMRAVPFSLREAAIGLGATRRETAMHIVVPASLSGIAGALLLAVSRAIGETMIVVMAAGLAANLTVNPLSSVTTVTVQIVTLLVGDQEFDSPKTLAAFALSLALFLATLTLNIAALLIVRKYREKYE